MKNILNFRPAFYFGLVFACGIFSTMLFFWRKFAIASVLFAVAFLAAVFALCFLKREAKKVLLLGIAFVLGCIAMLFQAASLSSRRLDGQTGILSGTVSDDFVFTSNIDQNNVNFLLRDASFESDGQTKKLDGTVRVEAFIDKQIGAGDKVRIDCTINDIVLLKKGALMQNYRTHTFWSVKDVSDIEVVQTGLLNADEIARTYIRSTYTNLLGEPHSATAIALVIGDTSNIEASVNEAFKNVGMLHIFSVSGLHITFVVISFNFVLCKLKIKRAVAFLLIMAGVFSYAWLCNFTPSVMRAVTMAAVLMFAKVSGRPPDILSSLGVAATAILLFRPLFIVEYGFLLSFASMFGISCISNVLRPFILKIKSSFLQNVASLFAVSLGASMGTFPLLIKLQGGFAIIGLLFNLIVIPLVNVIFVGLELMLIPLAFAIAIPLDAVLGFATSITSTVAELPFAFVSLPSVGAGIIFYFLLIFALGGYVFLNKKKMIFVVSSLCACVVVGAVLFALPPANRNQVYFLDSGGFVVQDKEGNNLAFLDVNSTSAPFALQRYCQQNKISSVDLYYIVPESDNVRLILPNPEVLKINRIFLIGEFSVETISALRQEAEVFQLDYGLHNNGIRLRTVGYGGKLLGMDVDVGGFNMVFVSHQANFDEVVKNFPKADVLVAQKLDNKISAHFSSAKTVSLELSYDRKIYSPPLTGGFTLRSKGATIATVY